MNRIRDTPLQHSSNSPRCLIGYRQRQSGWLGDTTVTTSWTARVVALVVATVELAAVVAAVTAVEALSRAVVVP